MHPNACETTGLAIDCEQLDQQTETAKPHITCDLQSLLPKVRLTSYNFLVSAKCVLSLSNNHS